MKLRRVLMWLQTSPPGANDQLIATAAKIAATHAAEFNAVITTPKLSRSGHWAVGGVISSMAADVESRCARVASELVEALDRVRAATGLSGATATQALAPHAFGEFIAVKGRTSDVVIAGFTADEDARSQVEALIFSVARPVLLLPHDGGKPADHAFSVDKIALAWDGSRDATRAAFDALPLLRHAKAVTLIQITDDKDLSTSGTIEDLSALLAAHEVETTTLSVLGRGRPTHVVLKDAFHQTGADVLVMGAYGHSRAREFILGGATRGTLQACAFPVLLSH